MCVANICVHTKKTILLHFNRLQIQEEIIANIEQLRCTYLRIHEENLFHRIATMCESRKISLRILNTCITNICECTKKTILLRCKHLRIKKEILAIIENLRCEYLRIHEERHLIALQAFANKGRNHCMFVLRIFANIE